MSNWILVGTINGGQLFIADAQYIFQNATMEEARELATVEIGGLRGRLPTLEEMKFISTNSVAYQNINSSGIHYWTGDHNSGEYVHTFHLIKQFLVTSENSKLAGFPVLFVS